jgi:hypothetical protein
LFIIYKIYVIVIPATTNLKHAFLQQYHLQKAFGIAMLLIYLNKTGRETFPTIQLADNTNNSNDNSAAGGNSGRDGAGNTGGDDDSNDFIAVNEEDTGTGLGSSDYVGRDRYFDRRFYRRYCIWRPPTSVKNYSVSGSFIGGINTKDAKLGNASSGSNTLKAGRAIKMVNQVHQTPAKSRQVPWYK